MEPQSTFALIAELALGLAGFSGVAAAFGGRDRSYAPVEADRLRSLFAHALLTLAICLLAISLLSFELDLKRSIFWSSAAGALGQLVANGFFIPRAFRYASDPSATPGWWGFGVSSSSMMLSLVLLGTSAASGGSIGLLVSALSLQLLFGLWVFTRLLIYRN